jgi:hypothetical protein
VISSTVIIPLSFYRCMAPRTMFIRTMLNVAALVGESFTTYTCDEKVTAEYRETEAHPQRHNDTCRDRGDGDHAGMHDHRGHIRDRGR